MITILKGNKKMEVAKSAFDNFYRNAGWIEEVKPLPKASQEPEDEDWDDALEEEYGEKPLSQMNNTELIEKAVSLGLDVDANMTNKRLRELIRGASR